MSLCLEVPNVCEIAKAHAREDEIRRGWSRLYAELVFRTVKDACDYARGRGHRFKACGGNRSWDEQATMQRALKSLHDWTNTDIFAQCLMALGINPDKGRKVVHDLLAGKDLDRTEELLSELAHEARVFGLRGPAPGSKAAMRCGENFRRTNDLTTRQ